MNQPTNDRRGRWVAIITGVISVLIGVLYLVLIVVLDSRGPLLPPPPEAMGLARAPESANSPLALAGEGVGDGETGIGETRGGAAVGDRSPAGAAQPG